MQLIFKPLLFAFSRSPYFLKLNPKGMALSQYEYVKRYEQSDSCQLGCWIVIRLDGRGFHKFSELHEFEKPSDEQALKLMNQAAETVIVEFSDIVLAYGQSDEYSFLFRPETNLFQRRASKLISTVVSLFSSAYTFHWSSFFPNTILRHPPTFDGRTVLYPNVKTVRDYFSWRQVDCHINNLYNTCFWKLVKGKGMEKKAAQERLKGTLSADKNEILFSEFGINYNNEPQIFRKGSVVFKMKENPDPVQGDEACSVKRLRKAHSRVMVRHVDIIKSDFWKENPSILGNHV